MRSLRALPPLALCCCAYRLLPLPAAGAPAPSLRPSRPALTVVLAHAVPRRTRARAAIERALGKSFALTFVDPPSVPPARAQTGAHAGIEADLAAARKAYIGAEFRGCLERVGELARVSDLLAEDQRLLAERLLFWRIACRVGAGRQADARRDAAAFATFDLEVPPDVEAAAPEVESLIAEALRAAAAAPRHPLRVTATGADRRRPPHARVSVDGRADLCVAPCTVDVPAGDHAVRVAADGYAPEARLVRVGERAGENAVAFPLAAADPELAARQWTARHGDAPAIDGAASVGLLSVALRARELAVVGVEPAAHGSRLTGALAHDGGVAARAERLAPRDPDVPDAAAALMRDLVMRGRLLEPERPLYKKPLFWAAVGVAAAAAATITTLLLYHPEPTVKVTL